MVAGGTGITPMWQVADHILRDGMAERTSVRSPLTVQTLLSTDRLPTQLVQHANTRPSMLSRVSGPG